LWEEIWLGTGAEANTLSMKQNATTKPEKRIKNQPDNIFCMAVLLSSGVVNKEKVNRSH